MARYVVCPLGYVAKNDEVIIIKPKLTPTPREAELLDLASKTMGFVLRRFYCTTLATWALYIEQYSQHPKALEICHTLNRLSD
jgi:hypothetical protein